jgi:hypothetical protein
LLRGEEGARPAAAGAISDGELIAWARRRGYVSLLFFFLVAAAVAVVWAVTR